MTSHYCPLSVREYSDHRGTRVSPNRLLLRAVRARGGLTLHALAGYMALLAHGREPADAGFTDFTVSELAAQEAFTAKLRRLEHGYTHSLSRRDWETALRALARIGWLGEVAA
jgi:hypothetical protein